LFLKDIAETRPDGANFRPDGRQTESDFQQFSRSRSVFCREFGGEFHSALRGCLGRIKDPLALKPLLVCARCLCEVYLRDQP